MSDPPTPNIPWYKLQTPGATSMSACVSRSLSRTPANPVTSNQTNDHRPKKRPYGTFNLDQLSNDPDRRLFSDKLIIYHIERGSPIIECPTINKQPLDLYEVYLAVKAKGGFAEVSNGEMWKEIAGSIGISFIAADTLRCQYIKHLLPFECKYDRGDIDPDGVLASILQPISSRRIEFLPLGSRVETFLLGGNGQAPQNLNPIQTQPTARTRSQRQLRPIFENGTHWHESVSQDLRHHLVQKIVQAITPTTDIATLHDTRMINVVAYARRVEGEMYGAANSREEYYQMLSEKIYKTQKELEEKRQNRKKMRLQQVDPGLEPMIENNSGAPSPKADEVHPKPDFYCEVLQDLKNLLSSGECSDVIIQVEDQQFKAHRSILTARSSVFAAMFRHDMKEKATGILNVEDCQLSTFPVFLEYLYCGSTEKLSSENVFSLYVSADKYDVQDLKKKCLEFMKSNLTVDTIYETFQIALQHSETDLLNFATDFFVRNLLLIIPTTKWETFLSENPIEGDRLFKKAEETYK